jgi:DNA-binding Lrp family transcriptional regulator
MAELMGESLAFFQVRPGNLEKVMSELRQEPKVITTEPTIGRYNMVVSGAFDSLNALKTFQSNLAAKEYCAECVTYPSISEWNRPDSKTSAPLSVWGLIRTTDPDRISKELQRSPYVDRVVSTTGPYNVIFRAHAKGPSEIEEVLVKNLSHLTGVQDTETLTGIRHP